jgi:hypothetical protein
MKDKDTILIEKTYEKAYFKYFAETFTNQYDEKETKTVDEVLEAPDFKQIGRITAAAFGSMWTVDMNHEACERNKEYYQILTENPDTVVSVNGKEYPRHVYRENTVLFTTDGNSNGVFYGDIDNFNNHGALMREILVNKNQKGLVKAFGTVSSRHLDSDKNGVVIPKQKDMDYSYVSVWFDGADENYLDTLREFVKFLKIETPVYLEHLASNDMTDDRPTGHILLVE